VFIKPEYNTVDSMNKHVPVAEPILGQEEYDNIKEVLDSGRFLQGPKVAEFEEKWADKVDVDHAVAVSNCTVALQLSLKALGLEPGDEVIVPSLTFGSTATAVVHQACVPVFADIDSDLYTLDHTDIERCISNRTEAILPVHLYGHPAEMDEITEIAAEHDLAVIEDAAQAHGASYKSQPVGSIGDIGCFSFYATKNITTGEGGIITTDNDAIAEVLRMLRNHGMANRDKHVTLGYNYRMSELHAALGVPQVDRLDQFNDRRTEISERYQAELADVEWLNALPVREYVEHAYFWAPFAVNVDEIGLTGKEVWSELKDQGVETRHRYTEPLYNQPVFTEHRGFNSDFPWSENEHDHSYEEELPTVESVVGDVIGLPNHPNLDSEDIDYVIKKICEMG
jgi:dTDP-4-amino-4,6-dideoxygalactose transaminase